MASLANANLPSSDEEDEDFVPDEVDSEDEAVKRKNAPKSKKRGRVRGAAGAVTSDDADDADEGAEGDDSQKEKEEVIPEHKRLEKKAKMDDLWSKLNAGQGSTKPKPAVNLASLCKPISDKPGVKANNDDAWMRQLGLHSATPTTTNKKGEGNQQAGNKDTKSVAAAALAAAKNAASATAGQQFGMVTVTEQRRFAGKTVTLQRDVAATSKEAAKAAADAEAAATKKAGLDAVLESLSQAKKVTVLDKSRLDWKDYKKTDDQVQEELEVHKRSGATYLGKKEFLGRAEVKEYERERDQRLASDVRNRGRL